MSMGSFNDQCKGMYDIVMYLLILLSTESGKYLSNNLISLPCTYMKCIITESRLILSPSEVASVCPGGRLIITCSTNTSFIRWNVTILHSGITHTRSRLVSRIYQSITPLLVNMNSFNVARNSSYGSLPLTSILSIANVSADVNGTKVSCTELGSSTAETNTLVTIVHVFTATDLGRFD